jgi:hypothetical protein
MTSSRQRSRRSARSASRRASRRCRGSRSSSPPMIDWASDGVVNYPGGPTTPTRARRPFDASVDQTEARNDVLGCFGRSDRRAQGDRSTLWLIRRRAQLLVEGNCLSGATRLLSRPSGFVLGLCIRRADEAWGSATLGHGLADTRFFTRSTVVSGPPSHDPGQESGWRGREPHSCRTYRSALYSAPRRWLVYWSIVYKTRPSVSCFTMLTLFRGRNGSVPAEELRQ